MQLQHNEITEKMEFYVNALRISCTNETLTNKKEGSYGLSEPPLSSDKSRDEIRHVRLG